MSATLEQFSRLLGLLYEGLAYPERWDDFLAEICQQLGCDKAGVIFHDLGNQSPALGFHIGLSDEVVREYNTYYGRTNLAGRAGIKAALRSGSWYGRPTSLLSETIRKKCEYYAWAYRQGMSQSVAAIVTNDRCTFTSLSVSRPEAAEPISEDGVELMRLLVPHLKRAFEVYKRLETLRASLEAAKEALDRLETGLIAVDGKGHPVLMNERAEAILREQRGLTVRAGRLGGTDAFQSSRLQQLVTSAAMTGAGCGASSGGAMTVQGGETSQPLLLTVTPFRSSHLFTEERPCGLIFISDPAAKRASRAALFSALFGMTPAECRLAGLLLEDMELRGAAERMHVTSGTARFMLKTIFHKTGTHRQAQLIRLLSMLPGEADGASATAPG